MGLSVVLIRKGTRIGPTDESRGTDEKEASLETGRGTIVASFAIKRFGRLSMDTSRLWPRRDQTVADKLWRPGLSGWCSWVLAFIEVKGGRCVGSCDVPSCFERGWNIFGGGSRYPWCCGCGLATLCLLKERCSSNASALGWETGARLLLPGVSSNSSVVENQERGAVTMFLIVAIIDPDLGGGCRLVYGLDLVRAG